MTLPCDYALDIVMFSVGGLCSCTINNIHLDHVLYFGTLNLTVSFMTNFLCLLYTVVCMHNLHSSHAF